MNLPFAAPATLATLFSIAALASAQTITPPPMKMGLWQTEITMQMSGMPNGGGPPAHTVVSQSCLTPDTWKDSLQNLQNRQHRQGDCAPSNVQQDGHHYSADLQCTTQQGFTATAHIDMQFDSDESMHGTSVATMSGGNAQMNMTMSSTIKSKFMGSDCGDVKPGQGKVLGSSAGPPS